VTVPQIIAVETIPQIIVVMTILKIIAVMTIPQIIAVVTIPQIILTSTIADNRHKKENQKSNFNSKQVITRVSSLNILLVSVCGGSRVSVIKALLL